MGSHSSNYSEEDPSGEAKLQMHQEACNPCNTVDAGVMEQSIKQSSDNARQTNTLLEPQLGVIWAPKASRKLTETSSFPGPEDREHSVCNHLQKR